MMAVMWMGDGREAAQVFLEVEGQQRLNQNVAIPDAGRPSVGLLVGRWLHTVRFWVTPKAL